MAPRRIVPGIVLLIALIALAPAAPASAAGGTTLCKVNETPCSAANHYAPGTQFIGRASNMTFTTTWGWKAAETINCAQSQYWFQSTSTGSNSSNVEGATEMLDFTECTLKTAGGTVHACENLVYNLPTVAIANTPETMNGTFTMSIAGEELMWQLRCPQGGTKCVFTAPSVTLDLTGGTEATLVAKEEKFKGTGGLTCPESMHWSANYRIEKPGALWLAQSL